MTYATPEQLEAYAAARGIELDRPAAVLLTLGMDYLESKLYTGTKTDPEQPNAFPRNGETAVPDDIILANLVAATAYSEGIDLLAPVGPKVLSESVQGAVSVTYSESSPSTVRVPRLEALLAPYLASTGLGANQFKVYR